MDRYRAALLVGVIAVLGGIIGITLAELLASPYTDQELQASLIDTWEFHAWSTLALLFLLVTSLPVSIALGWHGGPFLRRLSALAAMLTVLAGVFAFWSHVALTHRVTEQTGHTFAGYFGW
jgi:hypothetical protein